MPEKLKIIGVGGSLERNSFSLLAIKFVMSELELKGANTGIIDIKSLNLPLYDYAEGKSAYPDNFKPVLDEVHLSDALVLSSPEYHGTISAAFKNFIDYMEFLRDYDPPYFTRKPVGCIAIGGGNNSGNFTLNTMVNIVQTLRGISISANIAVPGIKNMFNGKNEITDSSLIRRLKRLADEIYFLAEKLK
jgi:FMN reductase